MKSIPIEDGELAGNVLRGQLFAAGALLVQLGLSVPHPFGACWQ